MAANPFRYLQSVEPQAFVGRWALVKQVASDLAIDNGDSYAIIAGRRCGKTSFLNTLAHQVRQPPIPPESDYILVPVFYDLKGFADQAETVGQVWALILKGICRCVSAEESQRSPDAWPCPVKIDIPWFLETVALPELRDLSDFTKAVGYVVDQLSAEHRRPVRLLLLFDEVDEALDHTWSQGFLNQLRALTSSEVKAKVRLVLAGSEHLLKQMSTRGSPLFNILKREYLEAFDRTAFDELTARDAGICEEIKEAVWNQSGGHPFLAQYLLHHIFKRGDYTDPASAVDEVVWKFCSEQFPDVDGWARAVGDVGLHAYKVLSVSDEWVDEDKIFRAVNHPAADIKQGLTALCYHGLTMHSANWRYYRHTGELFRAWCVKFKFGTGAIEAATLPQNIMQGEDAPGNERALTHKIGGKRRVPLKKEQGIIMGILAAIVVGVTAYWVYVYKPSHTETQRPVKYAGRVIDANTQQVMRGAKVSVEMQGAPQVYYTDSDGIFYLELPAQIDVTRIRVESKGYDVFDRNVSISRTGIEDVRLTSIAVTPSPTPMPPLKSIPAAVPQHTKKTTGSTPQRMPCTAEDRLVGKC